MKIKTKKQLNLPQLIEWAWKNDVKGENFPIDQNEEAGIYFATNNDFMVNNADFIRYNNTFTVEVAKLLRDKGVKGFTIASNYRSVIVAVLPEDKAHNKKVTRSNEK